MAACMVISQTAMLPLDQAKHQKSAIMVSAADTTDVGSIGVFDEETTAEIAEAIYESLEYGDENVDVSWITGAVIPRSSEVEDAYRAIYAETVTRWREENPDYWVESDEHISTVLFGFSEYDGCIESLKMNFYTVPVFTEWGAMGVFDAETTQAVAEALFIGMKDRVPSISVAGIEGTDIECTDEVKQTYYAIYSKVVSEFGYDVQAFKGTKMLLNEEEVITALYPEYIEVPDFSVLGAVTPLSEEVTQELAKAVYIGLRNHEEQINIQRVEGSQIAYSKINQALINIYACVVMGWDAGVLAQRQLTEFNLLEDLDALPGVEDKNRVRYLNPVYVLTRDDEVYYNMCKENTERLAKLVKDVDPAWSDAEKALYLYGVVTDYLTYNNTEKPEDGTINNTLKNGFTYCEGYAWMYGYLLNLIGVDNVPIKSNDNNHMWNLVKIDEGWYNVDTTCAEGRSPSISQFVGRSRYEFFLCNSVDILKATGARNTDLVTLNGISDPITEITYSNALWVTGDTSHPVQSKIVPFDGMWAMIQPVDKGANGEGRWVLFDFNEEGEAEIKVELGTYTSFWNYYDENGNRGDVTSGYGPHSAMQVFNGDLFITTADQIYQIQKKTSGDYSIKSIYTYPRDDAQFLGLGVNGDSLAVYLGQRRLSKEAVPSEVKIGLPADVTSFILPDSAAEEAQETTVTETTTTTAVTTTTTTTTTTAAPILVQGTGDADGSGRVDSTDLIVLNRWIMGTLSYDELMEINSDFFRDADMCCDGVIDAFDLVRLKRELLRYRPVYPTS